MAGYAWISLTTDYGLADGFVGICHGVAARLAPEARIIDITHLIDPGDVRRGAAVLAQTVGQLPPAVHVAVVDPGVGTPRRAIAVAAGHSLLVGPDNGLLLWAADALGGVHAAVELANPMWFAARVSRTFHGRDVFVPAAARLATGAALHDAGPAVPPDSLVRLPEPVFRAGDGWFEAEVLTVDRFGNVQLAAGPAALAALGPVPGGAALTVAGVPARRGDTFADAPAGEVVVLVDSAGLLAVAVNGGRAAAALSVRPGDVLRVGHPGDLGIAPSP